MTGAVQVLVGGDGGRLTGATGTVANTSLTTGVRSGTFALVNDGTMTGTGWAGGNWFTPTRAAIGSAYWAKATVTTQTNTTVTGTIGSWIQLTSGTSWGFSNTGATLDGTGALSIAFSPNGGTNTTGTMTVNWEVGYTP